MKPAAVHTAYIDVRREWLGTNQRTDLRSTVYRMDALKRLAELNQWGLELPLVVRDREISVATLNGTPPDCFDGPQPGSRALALIAPLARGLDVRLLQLGLSALGMDVKADGIFGKASTDSVRKYQASKGLLASGVADAPLIMMLVN